MKITSDSDIAWLADHSPSGKHKTIFHESRLREIKMKPSRATRSGSNLTRITPKGTLHNAVLNKQDTTLFNCFKEL